jgi:hypothetical protein
LLDIELEGLRAGCKHDLVVAAYISTAHMQMGWIVPETRAQAYVSSSHFLMVSETPDIPKETDSPGLVVISVLADAVTHSYHTGMCHALRRVDHNEEGHVVVRKGDEDLEAL